MANAPLTMHPDAQPDVPREDSPPRNASGDTPAAPTEAGPVVGPLAKAVNDLRNAVGAIGPVNFLPDTWPEDDLHTLRAATAIVEKLRP